MKGKSVGTNVFGSGILGPMFLLLKRNGVDPEKDIKLVETGFPGSEDAIRAGRVDVGVLNQPFAARAEAKGGLRKLFALADQQPNIVHILEVCRKEFVDKNGELVKNYVRDLTAGMYDRQHLNGTELRAMAGNFLFSTGANEFAGRYTAGHFDIPVLGTTITVDDTEVISAGVLKDVFG